MIHHDKDASDCKLLVDYVWDADPRCTVTIVDSKIQVPGQLSFFGLMDVFIVEAL